MEPEEKARLEAETKKLEAEAESLRSSGWNKPATWLPMLAAIAAIGTAFGQYQYSSLEERKAALDARETAIEAKEEEKRLRERNDELESIRASLLEDIKQSTSEIKAINSKIEEGNRQLLALARNQNDQKLTDAIEKELAIQTKEVARITESVEKRQQKAQLQNLVWQVNDAIKSNRLAAVDRLIKEHRSSRVAIELAVELLYPPQLEALTASGRINVLVFLRNTDQKSWDRELRGKALRAIDLLRDRAARHEARIGPQTDEAIRKLESFLNKST